MLSFIFPHYKHSFGVVNQEKDKGRLIGEKTQIFNWLWNGNNYSCHPSTNRHEEKIVMLNVCKNLKSISILSWMFGLYWRGLTSKYIYRFCKLVDCFLSDIYITQFKVELAFLLALGSHILKKPLSLTLHREISSKFCGLLKKPLFYHT